MRKFLIRFLIVVAVFFSASQLFAEKCAYCGSSSYGSGCYYSQSGKHIHRDDPKKCIYCGSNSYGSGCYYSPNGKHLHASGKDCIYCGSSSYGSGCYYSANGKHEH